MRKSEWAFFALAIVFVAGGFGLNRLPDREPTPTSPRGPFRSLGWYCPLPPGEGIGSSLSTVNLGQDAVRLRRWAVGASTASKFVDADLAPRHNASIAARDLGLPDAAGVVEAFGAATSSDTISLGQGAGAASSRCSAQPSNKWYFGTASTLRGRDSYLLVANPFEEEAVIKVRFLTREGDVIPARLKDLLVPQLSQTTVFLAEYFRETESFAVEVEATRGRVVVSRYDKTAIREGFKGLTNRLGSRGPSTKWFFAGGETSPDGAEYLHLANPSPHEALAQIIFQTDTEQLAQPALQEVPVAAGTQVSLNLNEHLPPGVRHGTLVASTNRVPIIAERQNFGSIEIPRGVDATGGVSSTAKRWALSVGSPAGGKELLSVVNFSTQNVVLRIAILAEGETRPPELAAIAVEAGRRATIDLTPFLPPTGAAALVEASTGSVVVERRIHFGDPYRDFADLIAQPL